MALPKAVEDAAKQADEMLQKMQEPPVDEKTDEAPVEGEQGKEDETPPETIEEVATEGEKKEDPPKETQPTVDQKEYDRLKQAHAVLQGKYNAEIPRLHEEIRDLKAKLAEIPKQPAQPDGEKPKNLDGVLKKLAEDYGDDFAENVQAAIDAKVATALSTIRAEVDGVKTTVARTREEKFLQELGELVPEWRETFNDPGFATFLDGEDTYSGRPLRELALEANNAMNAKRLARFYKAYLDSKKVEIEKSEAKTAVPETKEKDKREALITPATSGKPNMGGGGEKPDLIKASEMEKFYRDVTKGAYAYRAKEKEAMEERINRAIAKGWIVEG